MIRPRSVLFSACLGFIFSSFPAKAESDSFGLGDGHRGPLNLSSGSANINVYTVIKADRAPGDTVLPISNNAILFATGDLVMVYQATGYTPVVNSGDQGVLDLSSSPVGRWEFGRIASVGSTSLTLTAPLIYAYPANLSQVIQVPEYTSVTVAAGASINAKAWDGSSGGVVAFLATGSVVNNGDITANNAGFRGGAFSNDPGGKFGCIGLDEPFPGGGQKGESIVSGRYGTSTGYGNLANGGGGGNCKQSSGGGGANAGAGGFSASSADGANVGGRGGQASSLSPVDHLTLGGGGGGGQGVYSAGTSGGK